MTNQSQVESAPFGDKPLETALLEAATKHSAPFAAISSDASLSSQDSVAKIPDNFVDFYEILQKPPTSTQTELRRQISALYLEAQKNLDHRNPQKKLFFNQIYENHLPRARYVLLDDKRRAEYDGHVRTFRDDRAAQRAAAQRATAQNQIAPKNSQNSSANNTFDSNAFAKKDAEEGKLATKASTELDLAQLAAHRETLWQQWQESLDAATEIAPRLELVATPEQAARAEIRDVYMQKTSDIVRKEERARREQSRLRQQKRWAEQGAKREEDRAKAQRELENEKRRQTELAQHQNSRARHAAQQTKIGAALVLFLLGAALLLRFNPGANATASSTRTAKLSQGQSAYRSVVAQIPGEIQCVDYDRGMEGTSYHETTSANLGGKYRTGSGVDISEGNGSYVVTDTAAGEWIEYSINVARAGNYDLSALVASQKGGGEFQISVNGNDVSGAIPVRATGDNDTFQSVEKSGIALRSGQQILRLSFPRASADNSAGNFASLALRFSAAQGGGFAAQFGAFLLPLELMLLSGGAFFFGQNVGARIEKRHTKAA